MRQTEMHRDAIDRRDTAYYIVANRRCSMPDGTTSIPVSIRMPADVIETLDKVAVVLERSRSWVMLRAIRQYLADEGQEVLDVQEGIEEAERGECVPIEEVLAEMDEIIARAEAERAAR
jgi:predicted transcriptional regulator